MKRRQLQPLGRRLTASHRLPIWLVPAAVCIAFSSTRGEARGDQPETCRTATAARQQESARKSDPGSVQTTANKAGDPVPADDQPAKLQNGKREGEAQSDVVPAARVIEVKGRVDWAPAGIPVTQAEGWIPVKLNDRLEPGTQIRTGLRSHVNLQFGSATFVSIRRATYSSIDQFYKSATTETVRIGLGYGTVRGGSSEGEVRSDVRVESPAATLVKRGTDGWQMSVEAGTGRFEISLARHGLVEAIEKLRTGATRSREVRPGEYANSRNIANMWIKQNIFDRSIEFYRVEGLTLADADFSTANQRGLGALAPGGGSTLQAISGRADATATGQGGLPSFSPQTIVLEPIARPDGNFGTPNIFGIFLPRS